MERLYRWMDAADAFASTRTAAALAVAGVIGTYAGVYWYWLHDKLPYGCPCLVRVWL